jgi:hypothetical protein
VRGTSIPNPAPYLRVGRREYWHAAEVDEWIKRLPANKAGADQPPVGKRLPPP